MRLHYLQNIENRWIARSAGARHSLLVKLDRLIIGSILRSKLVFLIIVQLRDHAFIEGAASQEAICSQHSAECVDIDNESNQVP